VGSNPASPTVNQDRFSDPAFLFSAAFCVKFYAQLTAITLILFLGKNSKTIPMNREIFAYIQRK
jgi:hypothetical protein